MLTHLLLGLHHIKSLAGEEIASGGKFQIFEFAVEKGQLGFQNVELGIPLGDDSSISTIRI